MIRNNLATRPFYNERALNSWLLAIALATAGATAFNAVWAIRYTGSDSALAAQAAVDEAAAADARGKATRALASVDPRQVESSTTEARQANDLIDRRTFSWTGLFNQLETTLPENVRIGAVRPKLDAKRGIVLTISVAARSVEDVDLFMRRLDGTGVFADVLSNSDHFDEQGQLLAVLETVYVPSAAPAGGERGRRP